MSICNYVTCHISHVICQMLMLILGTCWTPFVFMCKICNYVTCHMSFVKCLCWSFGHAEQFLFSCLCSNVAAFGWKWQCLFFYHTRTLACEWSNHRAGSQLKKIKSIYLAAQPCMQGCDIVSSHQRNIYSRSQQLQFYSADAASQLLLLRRAVGGTGSSFSHSRILAEICETTYQALVTTDDF